MTLDLPSWISSLVDEIIVHASAKSILGGLRSLRERVGRASLDGTYTGAEDFWYRAIGHDGLSEGAKVCVTGLLSPFAPYLPSNPKAKPGYSAQGWTEFSSQVAAFLGINQPSAPADPLSESGYDVLDVLVWGDLVYRPRQSLAGRKVYAGLYNQYGKSFESVPVFIDENSSSQRSTLRRIGWPESPGALVEVTGEIRYMPSHYASMGLAKPMERPGLPCYLIEVSSIRCVREQPSVLYMTSWSRFGRVKDRDLATEFFDVMNPGEWQAGLDRLHARTGKQKVNMYFDSLKHPFSQYPKGNDELDAYLRKG